MSVVHEPTSGETLKLMRAKPANWRFLSEMDALMCRWPKNLPTVLGGKCLIDKHRLGDDERGPAWHNCSHNLGERDGRIGRLRWKYVRPCGANTMRRFGGGWNHELGLVIGGSTWIVNLWDRYVRLVWIEAGDE